MSDIFSRFVKNNPSEEDETMHETVHSLSMILPLSTGAKNELVSSTAQDTVLQTLIKYVREGWPKHILQAPQGVQQYWKVRKDIFYEDGLALLNECDNVRVVVPASLRVKMLKLVHEGHMGIQKCKSRASQRVKGYQLTLATMGKSLI